MNSARHTFQTCEFLSGALKGIELEPNYSRVAKLAEVITTRNELREGIVEIAKCIVF